MKPFAIRDRTGGVVARLDLAKAASVDLRRPTRGAGFIVTNPAGEIIEIHPATSESDERKHRRRAGAGEYRDPQPTPAKTQAADPVQLITDDEEPSPEERRPSEPPQETQVEVPVVAKAVASVRCEAEIEDEDDEGGAALDEQLSGVLGAFEQLSASEVAQGNAAIEALLMHHKDEGPTAQQMVDKAVEEVFGDPAVEQLATPSSTDVLEAAIAKAGSVSALAAVLEVHTTTIYKARSGAIAVSELLRAKCERYCARKKPGPAPGFKRAKEREITAPIAPTVANGNLEGQLLALLQPLIDARAQQLAEEIAHALIERRVAEHPDVRRARKILDAVKAVS